MTKVTIANSWVDDEGTRYGPGDTATVSPGVARDLLKRGKARPCVEEEPERGDEPVAELAAGAGTEPEAEPTPSGVETPDGNPSEASPVARQSKPRSRAGGKDKA